MGAARKRAGLQLACALLRRVRVFRQLYRLVRSGHGISSETDPRRLCSVANNFSQGPNATVTFNATLPYSLSCAIQFGIYAQCASQSPPDLGAAPVTSSTITVCKLHLLSCAQYSHTTSQCLPILEASTGFSIGPYLPSSQSYATMGWLFFTVPLFIIIVVGSCLYVSFLSFFHAGRTNSKINSVARYRGIKSKTRRQNCGLLSCLVCKSAGKCD